MERKIGEIFEHNGEWYQCVNQNGCCNCAFYNKRCHLIDELNCKSLDRKRKEKYIFKKLEKIGEPYYDSEKKLCQQYKCYIDPLVTDEIVYVFADNRAVIEIKQTKEDMEEKKLNLKPFDIQKAREGKSVCTRDGRNARIICFDRKHCHKGHDYPIVALISEGCYDEFLCSYTKDGLFAPGECYNTDLMMLPEKKEGWVNVYKMKESTFGYITAYFDTEEKAKEDKEQLTGYVETIKINWEE